MASAFDLKNQGNKAFGEGNYKEAERLYTRAIQRDPENSVLYTNRALTRIRLSSWDGCMDDCLKAIDIIPRHSHDFKSYQQSVPDNAEMKAWFYHAQAALAQSHPAEALSSALRAYEMCKVMESTSTAQVSSFVLRAKQAKWKVSEGERLKRQSSMVRDVEEGLKLMRERDERGLEERWHQDSRDAGDGVLDENELEEDRQALRESWQKKIEEARSAFALADPTNLGKREVPDYLIDDITFSVMHDPVVTKEGHSYERTSIEAHLRHSQTDPMTRTPLTKAELRPNRALREVCEEFLASNGWAVDW